MDKKGFAPIILVFILVGILAIGGIWYYTASKPASYQPTSTPTSTVSQPVAQNSTNTAPTGDLTELQYKNFTYAVIDSTTTCQNSEYVNTLCDGALVQVNSTTGQTTTLIPDLWQAIPDLKLPEAIITFLFANQQSLFFEVSQLSAKGNRLLGYYRFDLASKKIINSSYSEGACAATSPDQIYIADYYPIGTSSAEIFVFSLANDKNVYDLKLQPYQTIDDGVDEGPTCVGPTWAATDTVTFNIYDSSAGSNNTNGYPLVTKKTLGFPPLDQ